MIQILKVIDLKNNNFPAQAQVKRHQAVNGEQNLSLSFFVSEMNMDFLPDLDFNWLAEFDKEQYTILNPTIDAISKGKQIDAMLKFFTDLGGMYLQDEAEDKSMTALNAYTELFQGTGKTVHLVDNFHANTLNYQKNQSRLERFHYYNERFKAEFVVRGDAVYLYNRIGSYKPDVRIDEDLNVKSATVEIDSENFFTWCKCYFDLEESESGADGENYLQDAVYINQALYDEYGDIEGPALYQGHIRHESTMLEYAREQQEKSIQVSHSVDLVDLQRQGYDEFLFNIGDTVRLSLSSIDTTVDIRVVEINETFVENAHGEWERTELSLTLGNASKVQSYKQSRNDALQDLDDWINGRREPPMSVVPAAIRRAADIVMGDTDSVMEYRKDRLIGWHSKNEGNNVQLNVSGLVLHQNGEPKTAITPWGIVADTITTGMLNTNNVKIQGTSGRMTMDGDLLTLRNTSGTRQMDVQNGEIESFYNGNLAMKFGGYSLDFYNSTTENIGRLTSATHYSDENIRGLALVVENDFFSIGMRQQDWIRPVFNSSILSAKTVVSGPFESATTGSSLEFYANRRLVSTDTEYESDMTAIDQPAIIMRQGSDHNTMFQYFGGANRRAGATWQVRFRDSSEQSSRRIEANDSGVILQGQVGITGNLYSLNSGNDYWENNSGSNTMSSESASFHVGGVRVRRAYSHLYLGTNDGGEVRITNGDGRNENGAGPIYRDIRFRNWTSVSSEKYKTDITEWDYDVLEVLKNEMTVYQYKYTSDGDETHDDPKSFYQRGLIVERNIPTEFIAGDGVNQYEATAWTLKGLQEVAHITDDHSDRLTKLENELEALKNAG